MPDTFSQLVLEVAIGLVFLHASLTKIRSPVEFLNGLAAYQLLPQGWLVAFGTILTGCELFIGVSHLSGVALVPAIVVAVALLLALLGAVIHAMHRGASIKCSCFGSASGELVGPRTLARILVLLAAEITAWLGLETSPALSERTFEIQAGASVLAVLWVTLGNWLLFTDVFAAFFRACKACGKRKARHVEIKQGAS